MFHWRHFGIIWPKYIRQQSKSLKNSVKSGKTSRFSYNLAVQSEPEKWRKNRKVKCLSVRRYDKNISIFWQKRTLKSCACPETGHRWAQPDITSGPEVRQIVKIRTAGKPDIFLPGRRTFENRKRIKFQIFFFKIFFKNFFYDYLFGKMFKNISPDSVRSGRTCPANLVVRSCPVKKLICPVRLSPRQIVNQLFQALNIQKAFIFCIVVWSI